MASAGKKTETEENPQAAAKSLDVVTAMNPKLSFFHGDHERRRYSTSCTPIVSTYHCQFLNISLFMKVGTNHKILFVVDIVYQ